MAEGIGIQPQPQVGTFQNTFMSTVRGWDNVSAPLAANVEHRLTSQNGVQSYDPNDTSLREPLRKGLFMVKWLRWPPFWDAKVVEIAKWLLEEMVRGVSGLPENSISTIESQSGATKQKMTTAGLYEESGTGLSLKVPEFAGSPLRKLLKYWLSGVSDRKTAVNHFYGKKMRGVQANRSGTFIYILLGPTARPDDFEFACMLHNCMPYQEKTAHLATDIGDAGSEEVWDIEFKGLYDEGPEIDALARIIIEGYGLYGESFLNSSMPAYIYEQIVKNRDNTDMMTEMFSNQADFRMASASAANGPYAQDIIQTRSDLRDSASVPEGIEVEKGE